MGHLPEQQHLRRGEKSHLYYLGIMGWMIFHAEEDGGDRFYTST